MVPAPRVLAACQRLPATVSPPSVPRYRIVVFIDSCRISTMRSAGIKTPEQLPTMTPTILAARHLAIPVIAAGGIGDARGFLPDVDSRGLQ